MAANLNVCVEVVLLLNGILHDLLNSLMYAEKFEFYIDLLRTSRTWRKSHSYIVAVCFYSSNENPANIHFK